MGDNYDLSYVGRHMMLARDVVANIDWRGEGFAIEVTSRDSLCFSGRQSGVQ